MPQLDPNTFFYQYVAIIGLLIIVYGVLSYIVLPLILRAIIIRNNFITWGRDVSELIKVVPSAVKRLIVLQTPVYLTGITTNFFKKTAKFFLNLIYYQKLLLKSRVVTPARFNSSFYKGSRIFTFSLNYLILFILSEITINNDEIPAK
jgi:hypothetical protein